MLLGGGENSKKRSSKVDGRERKGKLRRGRRPDAIGGVIKATSGELAVKADNAHGKRREACDQGGWSLFRKNSIDQRWGVERKMRNPKKRSNQRRSKTGRMRTRGKRQLGKDQEWEKQNKAVK